MVSSHDAAQLWVAAPGLSSSGPAASAPSRAKPNPRASWCLHAPRVRAVAPPPPQLLHEGQGRLRGRDGAGCGGRVRGGRPAGGAGGGGFGGRPAEPGGVQRAVVPGAGRRGTATKSDLAGGVGGGAGRGLRPSPPPHTHTPWHPTAGTAGYHAVGLQLVYGRALGRPGRAACLNREAAEEGPPPPSPRRCPARFRTVLLFSRL